MSDLKFTIDEDGFALLETKKGYLQCFRGYRIQLSATPEGVGDNGSSSSVIHHHFEYVAENCTEEVATKFIHLVGLSHVGEALSGRTSREHNDVIKQIKQEPVVFNAFMDYLLRVDFNEETTYDFTLDGTLDNLESVKLDSLEELSNVKYLEGVDEGSVSLAIGTIADSAFVVDARTLEGYSLDFQDFATEVAPGNLGFTEGMLDFVTNTLLYLVTFKEEYPKLFPPHFYVRKKRVDSIQSSNIFG